MVENIDKLYHPYMQTASYWEENFEWYNFYELLNLLQIRQYFVLYARYVLSYMYLYI